MTQLDMTLYMDRAFSPQYFNICMLNSSTINPFANSLKKLGIPAVTIFFMLFRILCGIMKRSSFFLLRKCDEATSTWISIPTTEASAAPPIPCFSGNTSTMSITILNTPPSRTPAMARFGSLSALTNIATKLENTATGRNIFI